MPRNQNKSKSILAPELIENKIFMVRGKKVMIDRDLAFLYGVETRTLNQAVRRNIDRFPKDFMFQLTKEETENWKSQIVISNKERMGIRKRNMTTNLEQSLMPLKNFSAHLKNLRAA